MHMCLCLAKSLVKAVLAFCLVLGLFCFFTGSEEAWFIPGCYAAVAVPAARAGDRRTTAGEGRMEGERPCIARSRPVTCLIVADQEYSWRLTRFYHGDYLEGGAAGALGICKH